MKGKEILVFKFIAGEEKAFNELYKSYREQIYKRVFGFVKSHEIAEEILQDVFVKVWINRSTLDPNKSFSAFIHTIAKNTVYDYLRKVVSDENKVSEFVKNLNLSEKPEVESRIAHQEIQYHLNNILGKMPKRCREVYVLCKVEGRSHEEVSKILNISKSTINNQIIKGSRIVKANWNPNYLTFLIFFIFT